MQNDQKVAIRSGIFVILAIFGLIMMIFTVGSKRGYFQEKFTLKAKFSNVQGLWLGSSVRLAGVGVGKVTSVNFPQLSTKEIEIVMEIEESVKYLIRKDSTASIKWLSLVTGDSYIELTMGNANEQVVENGDYLQSTEPIDFASVFEDGMKLLDVVKKGLVSLESGGFFSSIGKLTKQLGEGLEDIKSGQGLLHALVYESEGEKIVHNLAESSETLKNILSEIKDGEGAAHQLIYDTEVKNMISNFSKMSTDFSAIVSGIKSSDGLLHALLYENKHKKLMSDMNVVSTNLREFVERINNGEGSLGAMINDPTLYDKIQSLLGGANQSFILKKLIKHSLKD